jgi:hypothetical protein
VRLLQLLGILRTYWRLARPRHWLFLGREETTLSPIEARLTCCEMLRSTLKSRSRCAKRLLNGINKIEF